MLINHDIHIHTKLSSCSEDPNATLENYILKAKKIGLKTIGISDHLWDEEVKGANEWYKPQGLKRILELKDSYNDYDRDIKVLIGAEAEFAKDILSITKENAKKLDYVLVPHSHTHMKGFVLPEGITTLEGVASYMVYSFKEIVKKDIATSIAHPFEPCGYNNDNDLLKIFSYIDDNIFEECFMLAKSHGTGIEINTGSFFTGSPLDDIFKITYLRMFKIAKECGCKFSFGSDTHSINGLDGIKIAQEISDYLNLKDEDLIELVR